MYTLAPYAVTEHNTLGRHHSEPSPPYRSPFQRDRDRIIHSAAFRRLEYKTQVFVNHEGDLYRTRLTHSIEVAQIARSIARAMQLNEDLTEAIALAHDLGHTPFGHAGQDTLNQCMSEYGGFEHNLQSIRVVDELEERYANFPGLNLTFESREGILKHCSLGNAQQLGDIGRRFLEKEQPSLEAQLTNLADEIAYNNHDVDDGLRSGLLSIEALLQVQLFRAQYEEVIRLHPDLNERKIIHEVVRRMINQQVTDLIETSTARLQQQSPQDITAVRQAGEALICFSPEMREQNLELKRFLRQNLYHHYRVLRMTSKSVTVIQTLFNSFMEDPRLLPPEAQIRLQEKREKHADKGVARAVADYIAGMTDRYAIKEYQRTCNPEEPS